MNSTLAAGHLKILTGIDICLFVDRFADLFVGYYNPNGLQEHRLSHVLWANISFKFFMEIILVAAPLILYQFNKNSLFYLLIKLPRYSRIFEIATQISEILEYYGQHKTVFDIKKMRK